MTQKIPDWLAADEFRVAIEIPEHAMNGEAGWIAEFRPLSLSAQLALADDETRRLDAVEALDRTLVALIAPDGLQIEREALGDVDRWQPLMARHLATAALRLVAAGMQDGLGEAFVALPAPGTKAARTSIPSSTIPTPPRSSASAPA